MDATGLLPVDRIAPMGSASLRLFDRAGAGAKALFAAGLDLPTGQQQEILGGADFLFRRWVLEIILTVRFLGPIGYGEISRALGELPSGSLSPKLNELQDAGIISRTETGDNLGSVLYSIPDDAARLADAVYTLTTAKTYQHATAHDKEGVAPGVGGFDKFDPSSGDATRFDAHLDAYAEAARAFASHHEARQTPAGFETALESATRFAETCYRKWQGEVILALLEGPARFASLRDALGTGDQALATALTELQAIRAVARGEDGAYSLKPFGVFDISLGFGVLALHHRLARSTRSA